MVPASLFLILRGFFFFFISASLFLSLSIFSYFGQAILHLLFLHLFFIFPLLPFCFYFVFDCFTDKISVQDKWSPPPPSPNLHFVIVVLLSLSWMIIVIMKLLVMRMMVMITDSLFLFFPCCGLITLFCILCVLCSKYLLNHYTFSPNCFIHFTFLSSSSSSFLFFPSLSVSCSCCCSSYQRTWIKM